MENSYKFDDNSTKETAIEIPKNQYSPQEDNQDRTKMSLPVNINVASPFLRLVLKNVYVEYRHLKLIIQNVLVINTFMIS